MVMQQTMDLQVGGSIPGRPNSVGAGRPGCEPPTYMTAVGCFTIRPLLALQYLFSPLLEDASATEKKPKPCVSVCLPACFTDCLADCWPD